MSAAPPSEADELYDELQSLIAPELGVPYLSKLCETDMSKYPLDGPMPDLGTKVLGIASFRNDDRRHGQARQAHACARPTSASCRRWAM